MRLVISWLREFVDVKASAEEIAGTLALRGFEVAAIEPLGGGDAVIDFEVTANRPDALSVLGLAREVATAYRVPLVRPTADADANVRLATLASGSSDRITVTIEDPELCPRYAAAVAEVQVAPSPAWMAARLEAAGIRPISNIVDITNYVNIEIGQPMHAFDRARLAGPEIRVRRARRGETIRTLDGVDRKLDPDMLVIADRDRAQAVAGVMGGAASEVSDSTREVVFESAYFKAASVRQTSKRLGLKTEASSRFERGGDIGVQGVALQRAIALIAQINAGRAVPPIIDNYPAPRGPRTLHLRRDRLARLFGASVPDADVVRILRGLELDVTPAGDGWDVVVPTFRVDVLREVDLIEEVGRHHGFDKLEPTYPPSRQPAPAPDPRVGRDRLVRRTLMGAGFSEAITFGFIEAKAAELWVTGAEGASHAAQREPAASEPSVDSLLRIANPLSAKFDTLRPSLLPGLIDAVAHNRRHGRRDVRLFEIGTTFAPAGEMRAVAFAWTGSGTGEHWSGGGREVDFFDVKGVAEHLSDVLGVQVRLEHRREAFFVPGPTAAIVVADGPARGSAIGMAGQVTPAVADARGLPRQDRVFAAELSLDALWRAQAAPFDAARALPRHPQVVRDLSIVVADTLPAEIIRGTILAAGGGLPAPLAAAGFFDRYQGPGVPQGAVSLSIRLTFQAADRTLTDAEVQKSVDAILAALVDRHAAVQR